jgi:Fic family protein
MQVTLEDLIKINIGFTGLQSVMGLRKENCSIIDYRGESRIFCPHELVPKAMGKFVGEFNDLLKSSTSKKQILHALSYFWLVFMHIIHPFKNGNGRTAKFILESITRKNNLEFSNVYLFEKHITTNNFDEDLRMIELLMFLSLKNKGDFNEK